MTRHMIRRAVALLCMFSALAGLAGIPHDAAAQEQSPFTLGVRAGYEDAYRIGEWFPVTLDVSNSGPDINGVLEWNFPGQLDEQVFRQEVELPRGSRKRVTLNVYAGGFARNGEVRLLNGDTVVASQDVGLTAIDEGVFLIVVVSNDPALLNSLETLQMPGFNSARVRHLAPNELPDHLASLRGLNAIFVHDLDSAALSPAQREALAVWVSLGGQLVVSGGAVGQKAAAGLADLLPAQVGSSIDQGNIAPLSQLVGTNTPPLNPNAPLSQAQPRPAAEQLPPGSGLLFRWRYGSGLATFSAFDFASLRGWPSETTLWEHVLEQPATLAPGAGARLGRINLLDRGVLQLQPLSLPATSTLLIFLLAYIMVLGPLNYLVLRRLRRLEWGWLTVPLIVLVFAGGLYVVGTTLRGGQAQFHQAAVVQGVEGQKRGSATAFIGLFSPRRAAYTIGFEPETLFNSAAGRATLSDQFDAVVTNESGARSIDVLADVGAVNTFVAHSIVDVPVIVQTSLISDTAGVRGEVRNTGPSALEDVLIVRGSSFARLGTLAPGASQRIEGALQQNFPRSANLPETGVFDRQEMLNVLFDRDFVRLNNPGLPASGANSSGVYLLAWVTQPTIPATVNGAPARQNGLTLYVIRLESVQHAGS